MHTAAGVAEKSDTHGGLGQLMSRRRGLFF